MSVFSWCMSGPPNSIPDHDGCPGQIGGPDGIRCSCPHHLEQDEEES